MLVANSFDLWQKDAFFSAAEEVQRSADIMESSYRTWLRARKDGLIPQHLDELSRELQMALGTAKWQLEEFGRAVRLSYRNHGDDITISRHQQFVSAIEDQISQVETAFKESFNVEGKKPFRWVNLDEEECDDLANFLSGTSRHTTDEVTTPETVATCPLNLKDNTKENISNLQESLEGAVASSEDANCFMEPEESRYQETGGEIIYQDDRIASDHRRTWSLPSVLEIVIDKDDKQKNSMSAATPKEKGSKPFFWSSRGEEHSKAKGVALSHTQFRMINWIKQRLRVGHRSPRQQQVSPMSPVTSMRFVLALMLTVLLVVPFLVYST